MKLLTRFLIVTASLIVLFVSPTAKAFTIEKTTAPVADMSGLWWNASESGWGLTLTQQFDIIFAAIYTYDSNGNPMWYTALCQISADSCTGNIYQAIGGKAPTVAWNGTAVTESSVGPMTFTFSDMNTGTMSFSINGVTGSKAITRLSGGSGSIVGTWVVSGAPISTYATATFYRDGSFLYFENDAPPNGAEAGTYTYNQTSGQLILNFTYDDNEPSSGFGQGVGSQRTFSVVISGNTATATLPDGVVTLIRQ